MKKIIAVILSIAMLLAVAACGKKTKDTGSSAEYIPQGDKLLLPAAALLRYAALHSGRSASEASLSGIVFSGLFLS